MRFKLPVLLLVFLTGWALQSTAKPMLVVPVVVGHIDDNLDACLSLGEVKGLSKNGDGFMVVQSGPGLKYAKIDKLREGVKVYVCDFKKTGKTGWHGIVYQSKHGAELGDCGVSTPLKRHAYKGMCKSGWVSDQSIEIIAG